MKQRIVIALGGNALGKNLPEQMAAVKKTAKAIVDLIQEGDEVVIAHGNGPQVGMIQNAMAELVRSDPDRYIPCPLSVCVAMSQGYIGYDLQNAIREEMLDRGIDLGVATVLTQVEVDPDDPAFQHPTKPIGSFLTKEEADQLVRERDYEVIEDAGRGYRRVVPSPIPERIVEKKVVEQLVAAGDIVITVGGGGIPVMEKAPGDYQGVAAVIDKDRASARLACDLRADMLVILTAVDKVSVNYRQPDQRDLDRITVDQARQYIAQGHFAPGSMLPKVESCIDFVEATGATALITSLERAHDALQGQTGTLIVKE